MWCSRGCLEPHAISDAWLCHVGIGGGSRRRGCAAAGVSVFWDGPLKPSGALPHVDGARADQPAGALLLEDVRRPARGARAGEQRRHQLRRHLCRVEHDRRPELDVGGQHAVRLAGGELGQRGGLDGLGHLQPAGPQLARRAVQHTRARVLGAVDAVAESHQPLAAIQHRLDVALGGAGRLDLLEHLQHPAGRAAVQGAGERADGGRQRGGHVGAGRGHDARGEGGGVHAVLGDGDPVGVDRLRVDRVGLAAPAGEEPHGRRGGRIGLRGGWGGRPASRLGDERQRERRHAGQVLPRLGGIGVDQLPQAQRGRERHEPGLQIHARVAAAAAERQRLLRRQAGGEGAVDQQAPHLVERHAADQLLDVVAAIAQRAAGPVRLRDLGGEGDDALQPVGDLFGCGHGPSMSISSTLTQSMLSTAEAARRLGVKPETLYAYVSRGLLTRHPAPGGRRSLFARAEVERLAGRARRGGRAGGLELVLDTQLTLLDPEGALYYRGRDATRLARESTYEEVAELLWGGEERGPWTARAIVGEGARPADRLRVIVALAANADPLRADLRPPAVRHAARDLIATMVDGLPAAGERRDGAGDAAAGAAEGAAAGAGAGEAAAGEAAEAGAGEAAAGEAGGAIAARLWARLSPDPSTPARLRALDAALILLADHELALSALAARVAASAHADPYLVVLAGLCAQGGALHGAAGAAGGRLPPAAPPPRGGALRGAGGRAVGRSLAAIPGPGAGPAAVGGRLGAGEPLPGFGHAVYTDRDPRADVLLGLLAEARPDPRRHQVLEAVLRTTGRHDGPAPNVDLALGALTDCLGLVPGSAEAIFAIARTAGLVAHALEEYPYRLRLRARAAYVGPAPR